MSDLKPAKSHLPTPGREEGDSRGRGVWTRNHVFLRIILLCSEVVYVHAVHPELRTPNCVPCLAIPAGVEGGGAAEPVKGPSGRLPADIVGDDTLQGVETYPKGCTLKVPSTYSYYGPYITQES